MQDQQCELGETKSEQRYAIAAASSNDKPGVLVVDDDNLVLIMLQLGLERYGFNVWPAHSGVEAVEMFQEHRGEITVALVDVTMPEEDGPAVWDALRRLDPDLRVCFMSGDLNESRAQDLRRRGAALLIAKPFLIHELAELLRLQPDHDSGDLLQPAIACN